MTPEDTRVVTEAVKNAAEALALVCAAVFFSYKATVGYLYVDLSLAIGARRTRSPSGGDILIVTATLKKGSRGSVRLHDAQARITWPGGQKDVSFVGIHRQSYDTEPASRRKIVAWDRPNEKQPLLRLPSDEQAEFACQAAVPSDAVCEIVVTVLGQQRSWTGLGQWKASAISPPGY